MPLSSNSVSATEPPLSDSSRILFWLKEMCILGSEAGAFEMQAEALAVTALLGRPRSPPVRCPDCASGSGSQGLVISGI